MVDGRRRRGEPGRDFKGSFGRAICTGREKRRITQKVRRGPNQQETIMAFIVLTAEAETWTLFFRSL